MAVRLILGSQNVYSEILFRLKLNSPQEDFGDKRKNLWMEQYVTWITYAANKFKFKSQRQLKYCRLVFRT